MSLSRDPDFLSLQLFHSNQKNWGLVLREPQYLAAIYNRALLAKDISVFNPAEQCGELYSHLSHSSSSSSLPVSPPVVYSVSYWDSSSSGLRLRLLPLLAEGFRPPPVSSDGLELVLPPWEKASDGLLVVFSEYLQYKGGANTWEHFLFVLKLLINTISFGNQEVFSIFFSILKLS